MLMGSPSSFIRIARFRALYRKQYFTPTMILDSLSEKKFITQIHHGRGKPLGKSRRITLKSILPKICKDNTKTQSNEKEQR